MSISHSDFIIPLMRSLRGEILAAYGNIDHEIKGNKTVVTQIDRQVEHTIADAITKAYPGVGICGEEHGKQGSSEKYWLIDPIDGTESYVRGLPGVTSMLALVDNDVVVESYIYDPVHDDMYSAFKDRGAYLEGKKITVADRPVERSILSVGSQVLPGRPELYTGLLDAGLFYVAQYFGAGLKAIYVASGKIDGLVQHASDTHGGLWDFGPTILLMEEAGAVMTSFDGKGLHTRSYSLLTPSINCIVMPIAKKGLRA